MRHVFYTVYVAFAVLLSSCSYFLSPGLYEEEIVDNVKFRIAFADYWVEMMENPRSAIGVLLDLGALEEDIDRLEAVLLERYVSSELTYKQVLLQLAGDGKSKYRKEARGILKHYNELNISLSDYVESSTRSNYKSWKFSELHSGIEFLFELEELESDSPVWYCTPVEKSYADYVERQFQ